jgi:hypothetical protein
MTRDLLRYEVDLYGADAEVDPETGFVFERGAGAHPKEVQTRLFRRQLADPKWVENYMRTDPHARMRHPHLFEGEGQ